MITNNTFSEAYKKLNKEQKRAVDTIDGPVMVIAGPGTGKTQVLSLRIANILQKTDVGASAILCLTFTRSGVTAMRKRLMEIIGTDANKVVVNTFHGFAQRLVEKNYELLGFMKSPELLDDTQSVFLADEILHNRAWEHLRPRANPASYFNDIKNATVRAVLPQEVKLTGKIFPEDARITFDSQSREIVWKIGDLLSGTGVISPILNTAFQISFIPEFNQRGQMPLLIKEAIVSGEDSWTERRLEARDSSINTTLPDDPAIDERQGIVQ